MRCNDCAYYLCEEIERKNGSTYWWAQVWVQNISYIRTDFTTEEEAVLWAEETLAESGFTCKCGDKPLRAEVEAPKDWSKVDCIVCDDEGCEFCPAVEKKAEDTIEALDEEDPTHLLMCALYEVYQETGADSLDPQQFESPKQAALMCLQAVRELREDFNDLLADYAEAIA